MTEGNMKTGTGIGGGKYPQNILDEMKRLSSEAGISPQDVENGIKQYTASGSSIELAVEEYKSSIRGRLGGTRVSSAVARIIGKDPIETANPANWGSDDEPFQRSFLHAFIKTGDNSYTLRSITFYGQNVSVPDKFDVGDVVKGDFKLGDNGRVASLTSELIEVQADIPSAQKIAASLGATHSNRLVELKDIQTILGEKRNNHFFRGMCTRLIPSKEDASKIIGFEMSSIGANPVAVWLNDGLNIVPQKGDVLVYGRAWAGGDGRVRVNASGVFQS